MTGPTEGRAETPETLRALDAQLWQARGHRILTREEMREAWPVGGEDRLIELHGEWFENAHDGFRQEIDSPTHDERAFADVVAEVERRGLGQDYIAALVDPLGIEWNTANLISDATWRLISAPLPTRCAAALTVLSGDQP